MSVRAKFTVSRIELTGGATRDGVRDILHTVVMHPVYSSDPNAAAAAQFQIGDEFYVDFTKVTGGNGNE